MSPLRDPVEAVPAAWLAGWLAGYLCPDMYRESTGPILFKIFLPFSVMV